MRYAGVIFFLTSSLLCAQGAFFDLDGGVAGQRLGHTVALMPDMNFDGIPEFLVSSPFGRLPTTNTGLFGFVELRDGTTGSVLRTHVAQAPGTLFGHSVGVIDDLTGDAFPDYVIGEPLATSLSGSSSGAVRYFSGASGAPFGTLTGSVGSRLGAAIVRAGDHNNDGFGDYLVHAEIGSVFLIDGASGSAVLTLPADSDTTMLVAGDLNFDGVNDFVLGFPTFAGSLFAGGSIAVHSGAQGALLGGLLGPSLGAEFGRALAALGDVNGDGAADFAVGAPGSLSGPSGRVTLYSGATLAPLWVYSAGFSESAGTALTAMPDQNGDGVLEVLVGAPTVAASGPYEQGALRLLSGADGSLISSWRTLLGRPPIGRALFSAFDVNGDQRSEVFVGDPDSVNGLAMGNLRLVTLESVIGPAGSGVSALRINGQDGGPGGRIDLGIGAPLVLSLLNPSASPMSFVLFGALGVPEPGFSVPLPANAGSMFAPPWPLFPGYPGLFTVASSFANGGFGGLIPAYPAPYGFTVAGGLPGPLLITLQAVLETSPLTFGVSNALILRVR